MTGHNPLWVIIYTRVSNDLHREGRSVASQERECRAEAERRGWRIADVLSDDDRSASRFARKDRPQYKRLMRLLPSIDVILTWEASRAQRDMTAYAELVHLCRVHNVLWSYSGQEGSRWTPVQVRRVLTSPTYAGLRVHKGEVIASGNWPAIVDEATYYKLREKFSDPTRRKAQDTRVAHLLVGLTRCGVCGGRMRYGTSSGVYQCAEGWCVSRSAAWLDAFITGVVVQRLEQPDAALTKDNPDAAVAAMVSERDVLQDRLTEHYDAAATGQISAAALSRIEAQIQPRIDDLDRRIKAASVPAPVADVAGPGASEAWERLTLGRQRDVIRALMTIRVLPAGKAALGCSPDTVEITWRT